jgi:mannose-6-phosphate isomerase-like protein (cupin superfamily)
MKNLPSQPYHEDRPWGNFIKFVENSPCTVKIVTIKGGESLSLQFHKSRDEFWHIISGVGTATIGEEKVSIESSKEFFVPRGTLHRIEAGGEDIVLLEIAYGSFDEADIVRTKDRYNRVG